MASTGSSDAHDLDVVGCYFTEFDRPIDTMADFVAALRDRRGRPRHRPGPTWPAGRFDRERAIDAPERSDRRGISRTALAVGASLATILVIAGAGHRRETATAFCVSDAYSRRARSRSRDRRSREIPWHRHPKESGRPAAAARRRRSSSSSAGSSFPADMPLRLSSNFRMDIPSARRRTECSDRAST